MNSIIPTAEKDIPLLQQLAEQSWKENYADILSEDQIAYMLESFYSGAALQKHFQNRNYNYALIATEDGRTAGFIGFEKDYEPHTTKLHRLYLLKSEKGKKLGVFAIEFLKKWAQQENNNRIILNVNKYNPAKNFYEKRGFRVYGEGVFDIGKGYVMDDYLMEYVMI